MGTHALAEARVGRAGGDHRVVRHDVLGDAVPALALVVPDALGGVDGAVLGGDDVEDGRTVVDPRPATPAGLVGRVLGDAAVDEGDVGGVEVALEALDPVALLHHDAGFKDLVYGEGVDLELGEGRGRLEGAHVGPDHPVDLIAGVGDGADLVHEVAFGGLVGHVEAGAGDVVLPAVVVAAEPALLVAAEEERRAPVGAVLGDEADVAVGIAEGDEVLAEEADALQGAVALRQVAGGQEGGPELAEEGAHGCAGTDPREEFVVNGCQHSVLPSRYGPAPPGRNQACRG